MAFVNKTHKIYLQLLGGAIGGIAYGDLYLANLIPI